MSASFFFLLPSGLTLSSCILVESSRQKELWGASSKHKFWKNLFKKFNQQIISDFSYLFIGLLRFNFQVQIFQTPNLASPLAPHQSFPTLSSLWWRKQSVSLKIGTARQKSDLVYLSMGAYWLQDLFLTTLTSLRKISQEPWIRLKKRQKLQTFKSHCRKLNYFAIWRPGQTLPKRS